MKALGLFRALALVTMTIVTAAGLTVDRAEAQANFPRYVKLGDDASSHNRPPATCWFQIPMSPMQSCGPQGASI
jgi:hypothetical protein